MKKIILSFYCLLLAAASYSQITTPVIRAGFGVDADLRSGFFNGFTQAGNDDWFKNSATTGFGVIDTVGAAFIVNRYLTHPASRMWPFFKGMAYPQFSIVNNKMLIDAIFIRDHHGDDSTVFASGSNKNGMHPSSWTTPVSQGIPDKNDILDMFMHVRRDGVNNTDSLWFFGGLSLDNTTGNRYFDFEMYQTDIVYNRATLRFIGFGPDDGHTAWQFDASGRVTRVGDIIFTAEYGSSSLTLLEARIWIDRASLNLTPQGFNWGGLFDGASNSATFGYASIVPKTAGTFYTGLQSGNNTWAGPFQSVLQNNSLITNYSARQFMEFSVNLSKLGLDPLVTVNDACALPFRKILVKSRASTSFTAELKDFVGPFSFFRAPSADIATNFPMMCPNTISNIWVTNPVATSIYTWRALSGNIVGDTVGTAITVNQPGTYVVSQELMDSCKTTYARDTIQIRMNTDCILLGNSAFRFNAKLQRDEVLLSWKIDIVQAGDRFEIERSYNGLYYNNILTQSANYAGNYEYRDKHGSFPGKVYYRLKVISANKSVSYSQIEQVQFLDNTVNLVRVMPNPAADYLLIQADLPEALIGEVVVYNNKGAVQQQLRITAKSGTNQWRLNGLDAWSNGVYFIKVLLPKQVYTKQLLIKH